MEKRSPKKTSGGARSRRVAGAGVAVKLPDGVVMLKSPGRATHFSDRELSLALDEVLRATGRGRNAITPKQSRKG